ncbi:MAG: nucleoside deaminase [Erysipelotrichaceae bacterium]|nr:nucleoside deaminase [Erysipelotrichaceae bacterium]
MNKYMEEAYKEAKKAYAEDEVPVGCVIVKDEKIIARAHNRKEKKNCAVFHAEIECINKATKKLNNWNLKGCDLYVTLEPCMMCTGAIVNSRIDRIYFGCKDPKGGALVSNVKFKRIKNLNHYPEIKGKIDEEECSKILKDFFKNKRIKKTK